MLRLAEANLLSASHDRHLADPSRQVGVLPVGERVVHHLPRAPHQPGDLTYLTMLYYYFLSHRHIFFYSLCC